MASLICFEISSDPAELKRILSMLGYKDKIEGKDSHTIFFPATTLYHASKAPAQALREMEVMCTQLQLDLKRCKVTTLSEWTAICEEPSDSVN